MITFWSLMVENASTRYSPKESNPPSPLHLLRLNKPVWRGYTPTSISKSGLPQFSIGLCKSAKYAKKMQGNKWVFCTESFIPLQTLHHSYSCTWLTSVHIWSMQHLGLLPTGSYQISGESAEVCTEGVHQKLEFWIWVYVSVMQPAHPCHQKTLYETVSTLSNCQWTSKFPCCTHCTMKPVQISKKHQ